VCWRTVVVAQDVHDLQVSVARRIIHGGVAGLILGLDVNLSHVEGMMMMMMRVMVKMMLMMLMIRI
jgi:hypothetical protein